MASQRQCATIITIGVPICRRFQVLCALQGQDASSVVGELINVYLAEQEEPTRAAAVAKGGLSRG